MNMQEYQLEKVSQEMDSTQREQLFSGRSTRSHVQPKQVRRDWQRKKGWFVSGSDEPRSAKEGPKRAKA